jgi:hypothetical protein
MTREMRFCNDCGHVHAFEWRGWVNGERVEPRITRQGVGIEVPGRNAQVGDSFTWELVCPKRERTLEGKA